MHVCMTDVANHASYQHSSAAFRTNEKCKFVHRHHCVQHIHA